MKNLKTEFPFVHDKSGLISYIKTLPAATQLRYPSHTSLDGNKAVPLIVPNKNQKEYFLLTPYKLLGSSTRRIPTFTKEKLSEIVKKGFLKETFRCLRAIDWQLLGSLTVPNSAPGSNEPHVKHVEWIKDYQPDPWQFGELSDSDMLPIWVHIDLFPEIFEEIVNIGGKDKEHPQRMVWSLHKKWLPVMQDTVEPQKKIA